MPTSGCANVRYSAARVAALRRGIEISANFVGRHPHADIGLRQRSVFGGKGCRPELPVCDRWSKQALTLQKKNRKAATRLNNREEQRKKPEIREEPENRDYKNGDTTMRNPALK